MIVSLSILFGIPSGRITNIPRSRMDLQSLIADRLRKIGATETDAIAARMNEKNFILCLVESSIETISMLKLQR